MIKSSVDRLRGHGYIHDEVYIGNICENYKFIYPLAQEFCFRDRDNCMERKDHMHKVIENTELQYPLNTGLIK